MTREQIDNIRINHDNVRHYLSALSDLVKNRVRLGQELERYPMEVCFVDFRTLLCKKKELCNLIKILGFRIKEYEMLQG
jgi:hypothetical protein